ncbi:MAG TPA: hypothetical protein DC049_12670 [Spirochaetia bacterium]|nr:hypothetical protein [Spirochaetia bacterium]
MGIFTCFFMRLIMHKYNFRQKYRLDKTITNKKKQIFIAIIYLLIFIQTVFPGNLFYNSSFELGDKGYACFTEIPYVFGEKINYHGSPMSIDYANAFIGEKSLLLSIKANTYIRLSVHEMELQQGQKYTISFYAKNNQEKCVLRVNFASVMGGWRSALSTNIIIDSPDWQRYSCSFVINQKPKYDFEKYYIPYFMNMKTNAAQLWLDAMQLEAGDLSAYSPARPLECAVYVPGLYTQEEQLKGSLQVISYQDMIAARKISLTLADNFFNKTIGTQEYQLDLPAGKTVSKDFISENKRLGSLRLCPDTKDAVYSSAYFVRIVKPGKKWGNGFQMGMHTGVLERMRLENNVWGSQDLPSLRWNDNLGAPGSTGRLVRLSGATFAHSWGSFAPFYLGLLKPEKNKYNWILADSFIEEAEKNSLAPIAVVPTQSLIAERSGKDSGKMLPAWLRDLDTMKNPKGTTLGDWKMMKIILPPPEIIGEFFSAMAKRYGSRVKAYQLFPEANGYMQAEHFIDYIKAVYQVLKKENQENKLIALTPTEDFDSQVEGFFSKCLALGAGNYCDIYAVHPYRARMDDSPLSAMKGIRNLWGIMDKYNEKKSFWNTELYYLLPTVPSDGIEMRFTADALARRLIIDMGEGLTVSCPLEAGFMFHNPDLEHQDFHPVFGGSVPSDRYAVFSAAARFLIGAEPVKTLELPRNVLCYVFQNDGKYFSAIWSIRDKVKAALTLPPGTSAVLYDIFGNEFKTAADKLEIALDRSPQYIAWQKAADASLIITAIASAVMEGEKPFALSAPKLVFNKKSELCCGVILQNETAGALEGMIRINSKDLERGGSGLSYGSIPSGQSKNALVPVEIKPEAGEYLECKMIISGLDKVYNFTEKIRNVRQIKLQENNWTDRMNIEKILFHYEKKPQISSPQDFSADFSLSYSASDLLIKVKVCEDGRSGPTDSSSPWDGDCLELFLDLNPPAGDLHDMNRYHDQCFQLLIPSDKEGKAKAVRMQSGKAGAADPLVNIQAEIKNSASEYEITVRLPLKNNIGALKENCIGFTLAVNDNDAGKYKYNLTWAGEKNFMNRSGFALLYFQ